MSAFLYGVALQWKLDIRSRSLLVTCYLVPLLFFAIMGGIFTSLDPAAKTTLIPVMTVMGISMGALIGLPPSLLETYGSDIKKVYQANGVPLWLGLVTMFLSAFLHLLLMSGIIFLVAPLAFDAALPQNLPVYFVSLSVFLAASLSIGCVQGLTMKSQAKLTMVSQLFFFPSIMLSGIMFPIDLLPKFFISIGKLFPASWGYRLLLDEGFSFPNLWPLVLTFFLSALLCRFFLKRIE